MKNVVKCPTCGKPHEAYYLVRAHGKRELVYSCDKQQFESQAKVSCVRYNEIRSGTRHLPVTDNQLRELDDVGCLREVWTLAYRKEMQAKRQLQMPMFYGRS